MINKNIKNIGLIIISILLLIWVIYGLIIFAQKQVAIYNYNIPEAISDQGAVSPIIEATPILFEEKIDPAVVLQQLKDDHPEYTTEQIDYYTETAKGKNIGPCLDKTDRNDCITAVAFLSRQQEFCGEIADSLLSLECNEAILAAKADIEIANCKLLNQGNFQFICFINLFSLYTQPADCQVLKTVAAADVCRSAVYYNQALSQSDKSLCEKITDNEFKDYCLASF